jgi:hypothetical protein
MADPADPTQDLVDGLKDEMREALNGYTSGPRASEKHAGAMIKQLLTPTTTAVAMSGITEFDAEFSAANYVYYDMLSGQFHLVAIAQPGMKIVFKLQDSLEEARDARIGAKATLFATSDGEDNFNVMVQTFDSLQFQSKMADSVWTAVEAKLLAETDTQLDSNAVITFDPGLKHDNPGLFTGESTDEERAADEAATKTFDGYTPPPPGTAGDLALDAETKALVKQFLAGFYRVVTQYQEVWKQLTTVFVWGRLLPMSTNMHGQPEKLAEAGGIVDREATITTYKESLVAAIAAKTWTWSAWKPSTQEIFLDQIRPCIGHMGWMKASDLGAGYSYPVATNIVDNIKSAHGTKDTKGTGLPTANAMEQIASGVVENIKQTNFWEKYLELLQIYAKLVTTLDALVDGEITADEVADIEAAAEAATVDAVSAAVVAAVPDAVGTAGSAPAAGSKKEKVTNAAKESAANIRTSIRDYLTINTPYFAAINEKKREEALTQATTKEAFVATFRGVYPIEGRSESGVSQLMYNKNQQALLDLTPAEISSLVPMIRIFKKGTSGGTDYEQELPFENNVINSIGNEKAKELNGNMIVENYNKGNSVGIRSFEWDYQGTNPANDTKDITMTLTLYFQSFSDILRVRDLGSPVGDGPGTFSYADLITRPKRLQDASGDHRANSHWDPEYYRIKFLVGHAYSDPVRGSGDIIPKEKRFAIDTTVLPLIATLIDHRFDIQEDGSVNLIITYRGYLEAIAFSQGANIFSDADLEKTFQEARDLYNSIMKECSDGRGEVLKANLTQQLDWFGKELQQEVFSSIISKLRKDNKIFSINPYVKDLISRKIISNQLDLWPPLENAPVKDISEIIKASGAAVTKCTEADKTKCVEDIFTKFINPPQIIADGRRVVPFFYVGDLIKTVKSVVEGTYGVKQKGGGTSAERAFINTRLILTDIRMTQNPNQPDKSIEVNLTDIPISVETFSVWFVKYITKYQGNRQFPEYSFGLFLSDFLKTVLSKFKSFADESGTSHSLTDASSIQRTQLYAPEDTVGDCALKNCAGKTNRGKPLTYGLFSPKGKCKAITRVSRAANPPEEEGTVQMYASKAAENWINYFIFYPNIAGVKDGTVSFPNPTQENLQMGYYQFNFGVNSGMVKKITFEKDDQPYVREARFFASETNYKTNRILQLREPYKITIDTFGLPTIFPGAICYIDSRTIDMALGKISDPTSLAYMLGFGGYHMITHVKNSIRSGQFSTTLTAKWTSHGGAKDLNSALNRASSEIAKKPACALFGDGATSDSARKGIEDAFQKANGGKLGAINLTTPAAAGSEVEKIRQNYPGMTVSQAFKDLLENKRKNIK